MLLVVDQTDTLAKCEEFQRENTNCLYFYFDPKPWTLHMFRSTIMDYVVEALQKDYNCAWYRSQDVKFHLKYIPKSLPNGILFFHDGKFKAHMDLFDKEEFVALLAKLPEMKEMVVDTGEDKPKEVKKPPPRRNNHSYDTGKDYSFKAISSCVIL
ncbi:hypothetical protein GGI00_005059 [Coemansia sp. RSA 2681]|nr:hypothetical protein GGI00_005059 [Coemansia sp. RSA 2681]